MCESQIFQGGFLPTTDQTYYKPTSCMQKANSRPNGRTKKSATKNVNYPAQCGLRIPVHYLLPLFYI